MPHTLAVITALAATVLLSASVQGFTGFGFGLVGMALCTPLLGPQDANILWTMLSLVLTATMWILLWRHAVWPLLLWSFVGCIVGLPFGVWVLANSGPILLERIVGAAILVFALHSIINPRYGQRRISPAWGIPPGIISGFFSGATSMGGPAVVIFLLICGLDKDRMKGTLAAYFTLGALYKMLLVSRWVSLLRVEHFSAAAILCVPALAGMAAGMRIARRIPTMTMKRIICVLLLFPGALLLLR